MSKHFKQPISTKRYQITRFTKCLSRIFEMFVFWPPKTKIWIFLKEIPTKLFFEVIPKIGMHVTKLCPYSRCTIETRFLELLGLVQQNKWHFWNPEPKLNKIGMFLKCNLDFQNSPFLTWNWHNLRSNVKMSVTIEFYVWNGP